MTKPILPGATIGILGSGQLGRMLALEARRMGYRIHVLSPATDSPTGQIADLEVVADYDDVEAVAEFAKAVDVVTLEFENIPATTLEAAERYAPVRPGVQALHISQNRLREKTFLAEKGFPVAPFRAVYSLTDIDAALADLGAPAVLKTAGFGYDGKGQAKIDSWQAGESAFQELGAQEAVLEAFVDFEREVSVVAARGLDGSVAHYGVIENQHRHHILDVSLAPPVLPKKVINEAVEIASGILAALDVVGVMCVEFFLRGDETLLVNELAPRPHNSGHLTIEACYTSQFAQQLRAVCGLPLGATDVLRPAAMANLLGDLWKTGTPRWERLLALPGASLHLYGKQEARAGRKMGHLTALANNVDEARQLAIRARNSL